MPAGYFGKLPLRGDFVEAGAPAGFSSRWDAFVSAGLERARADLGAGFDAAYRTAPLWRFACAPGVLGEGAVIGVVGPSVDAAGRLFPLAIVAAAAAPDPATAMAASGAFFAAAEPAIFTALDPASDMDVFERTVAAVPAPSPGHTLSSEGASSLVVGAPGASLGDLLIGAGGVRPVEAYASVWWSEAGAADGSAAAYLFEAAPEAAFWTTIIGGVSAPRPGSAS